VFTVWRWREKGEGSGLPLLNSGDEKVYEACGYVFPLCAVR